MHSSKRKEVKDKQFGGVKGCQKVGCDEHRYEDGKTNLV